MCCLKPWWPPHLGNAVVLGRGQAGLLHQLPCFLLRSGRGQRQNRSAGAWQGLGHFGAELHVLMLCL